MTIINYSYLESMQDETIKFRIKQGEFGKN